MTPRIAVLGAGITGLTIAHRLKSGGLDATLFEASSRPGGMIESVEDEGFIAECGPHTFLNTSDALAELIVELGLKDQICEANPLARKRFTVKNGEVVALPMSPRDFWKTPIYSGKAKARLLRELFVSARDDRVDESIASFVTRRFGREFLDYGVDLLVQGIWAGDPENLSIRHAFSKLHRLESQYGSVIRGAVSKVRSRSNAPPEPAETDALPHMFGFRDGNESLPRALASRLDGALMLNHEVTGATPGQLGGWRLDLKGPAGLRSETFDYTVAALPPDRLFPILEDRTWSAFDAIDRPPVGVVTLAYERSSVGHPLDGFGMLIAAREPFEIMGAMFTSTLFENRCPRDHVTIAVFMGGARRREQITEWTTTRRLEVAQADLRRLLDIDGEAVWHHESLWSLGIPQYEVGYGQILRAFDQVERALPNLTIAGNARNGVAVPALVSAATEIADDLIFRFQSGDRP